MITYWDLIEDRELWKSFMKYMIENEIMTEIKNPEIHDKAVYFDEKDELCHEGNIEKLNENINLIKIRIGGKIPGEIITFLLMEPISENGNKIIFTKVRFYKFPDTYTSYEVQKEILEKYNNYLNSLFSEC